MDWFLPDLKESYFPKIQNNEGRGGDHDSGKNHRRTHPRHEGRDFTNDHTGYTTGHESRQSVFPNGGDYRADPKVYGSPGVPERGNDQHPKGNSPGNGNPHGSPVERREKKQARHRDLYEAPSE